MQYKCNNCKHTFESDDINPSCPFCDATDNIKPVTPPRPKWIYYLIGAIVLLIVLILLFRSCGSGSPTGRWSYDENKGIVEIEITGSNSGYIVYMEDKTDGIVSSGAVKVGEMQKNVKFRNNITSLYMQEEHTYLFILKDRSGQNMNNVIQWENGQPIIQIMANPPEPEPPTFAKKIYDMNSDCEMGVYTVTIHAFNTEEYAIFQGEIESPDAISNWQSDSVFSNVSSGTYSIAIRSDIGGDIKNQQIILKKLDGNYPSDKNSVERILNGPINGPDDVGAICDKLGAPDLRLEKPVVLQGGDAINTLYDAVMARQKNPSLKFSVKSVSTNKCQGITRLEIVAI